MGKLVNKALTNLKAHFIFLALNKFEHCDSVWVACNGIFWVGANRTMLTWGTFSTFKQISGFLFGRYCTLLGADAHRLGKKWKIYEIMECVYVLDKCLGHQFKPCWHGGNLQQTIMENKRGPESVSLSACLVVLAQDWTVPWDRRYPVRRDSTICIYTMTRLVEGPNPVTRDVSTRVLGMQGSNFWLVMHETHTYFRINLTQSRCLC
jgi:hypothetical protein